MTQPQKTDEQIGQALTALFPGTEPSPALAARVAALAARQEGQARSAQARRLRWRLAVAVGAALLAVGAFQLTRPTLAAALLLARMDGAMQGARSAHIVRSTLTPGGSWVKSDEDWYQSGQWRLEDDSRHSTQVYAHGRLWNYTPQTNTVTVERRFSPFAYMGTGFSVKAILGSGAFGPLAVSQAQSLGDTALHGRRAHRVAILTPAHERMIFWSDPTTDLPFYLEAQRMTPQGWQTGVRFALAYDQLLPQSLFVPEFPRTAKVMDLNAGSQVLHQQWVKGIAQQHIGGRVIVIRDMQVNPRGDVFLLYTAGHQPGDFQEDVDIRIKNDLGYDYNDEGAGRDFKPIFRASKNDFLFGGEELEGFCQAPHDLEAHARSLTITFLCTPVPQHGVEAIPPVGTIIEADKSNRLSATFTLPIPKRMETSLPDYMPYMALPLDKHDLDQMHGKN